MSHRQLIQAIERELDSHGITDYQIERSSKHKRVVSPGRPAVTFSASASDHRAWRNVIANLRKAWGLTRRKA